MELNQRIYYLSFILVGLMFILVGIALDELAFLEKVDNFNFNDWYSFLEPWIGNAENGLPVPWN